MKNSCGYKLSFLLLFLISSPSDAYDIFPGKLAIAVSKEALHEQMSLDSMKCALSEVDDEHLSCNRPDLKKYITYARPKLSDADWALVRGVEWPDNPVRTATSKAAIGFAAQMVRDCVGRKFSTGGLVCKSHYYDMQFMHAMASEFRQPSNETQEQILEWLGFVYEAILDPAMLNLTLGEIMSDQKYMEISKAVAPVDTDKVKMSSWRAWSLFSYLDANNIDPNRHEDLRNYPFEFLMGVMLHTIQDSFSAAHNRRGENDTLEPKVICKPIYEFFTYEGQDGDEHGKLDKAPIWDDSCTNDRSLVDEPILAGARLIRMAKSRTPWTEVKTYLQDRVFPIKKSYSFSSNGPLVKRN